MNNDSMNSLLDTLDKFVEDDDMIAFVIDENKKAYCYDYKQLNDFVIDYEYDVDISQFSYRGKNITEARYFGKSYWIMLYIKLNTKL